MSSLLLKKNKNNRKDYILLFLFFLYMYDITIVKLNDLKINQEYTPQKPVKLS